jgi:hypothetical protein
MEREKTIQELVIALKTLKLKEADLTLQLEEAIKKKEQEPRRTGPSGSATSIQGFSKGDRFWIKNKLHKPANWNNETEWNEKEGKTAIVTKVLIKGPGVQVRFLTDNGVQTWQAPNNMCPLTPCSSRSNE